MICNIGNEDGIPRTHNEMHRNWAGKVEFRAERTYLPGTRAELVEIIKNAEDNGDRAKAVGSKWSFNSSIGSNKVLIKTDALAGEIPANALLGWLPLTESARARLGSNMIRHVRGGTKVCALNRLLHGLPAGECGGEDEDPATLEALPGSRAFPTLGGSGGQSIAGVISTGTHGGDVYRRPIADHVLAIHLVGPGGQEWWIERPNTLTMGNAENLEVFIEDLAERQPGIIAEICPGVKVRKSEAFFRAAMVAIGRMGVIYSLVVSVENAFKLKEFREDSNWESFRNSIAPANYHDFIRGRNLHFLSVLINPFAENGLHKCKVIQRQRVPLSQNNFKQEALPIDFQGILCSRANVGRIVTDILLPLQAAFGVVIATALAVPLFGQIFAPFIVAGAIAAEGVLATLIATLSAAATMNQGELIALVADALYEIGAQDTFAQVMGLLLDASVPAIPEDRATVAMSWKVMDTYNYQRPDNCQKVDAMEVAFDVDSDRGGRNYLAFISEALDIFQDLRDRGIPVATVFSLRFSRGTEALLGMSQFVNTCHVEIPMLQSFAGNAEMLSRLHAAAIRHNGRPHWGQVMRGVRGRDIEDMYGDKLRQWQAVLKELIEVGGGKRNTFSNNFTRFYHLEPDYSEELRDCILTVVDRG
ncbi:MAG TPA: hypothetical protein ENJ82_15210 [Bacteroidetes bacterium]|nr:hypothetical protein [Bacteroidota bacterium]